MKFYVKLFIIFIVFFSIGQGIGIGINQYFDLKDQLLTETVAKEIAEKRVEYYQKKLEEPFESEVIYHARDHRTKDFFTFMKMKGRGKVGYKIITDLPIDRDRFDLIYDVLVDSIADLNFAFDDWYGESRIGTNSKHKRNKDGSIDFGDFGKNYKKGTSPAKVGAVQQAKDYCEHYNSEIVGHKPEQRRSRYYEKYWWLKDREKTKKVQTEWQRKVLETEKAYYLNKR